MLNIARKSHPCLKQRRAIPIRLRSRSKLKKRGRSDINRLFVIQFLDRASSERFFTDSQYVEIRARLFEKAVAKTTTIAEYVS